MAPILCTSQEAINSNFIIREVVKLLIGVFLFMIYIRLIYILIRRRDFFSNIFYKLVIINGISVVLISLVSRNIFLGLRVLSILRNCQQVPNFSVSPTNGS
jgi:hypothetical protein